MQNKLSIESILWTSFTACVADAAYRGLLICHDRCEITETQRWITHSNGSFSKSLFYVEKNEYLQHTLDKYFSGASWTRPISSYSFTGKCLRLRHSGSYYQAHVLRMVMTQIVVPQWWEHLPCTNVTRVKTGTQCHKCFAFQSCWFSSLL